MKKLFGFAIFLFATILSNGVMADDLCPKSNPCQAGCAGGICFKNPNGVGCYCDKGPKICKQSDCKNPSCLSNQTCVRPTTGGSCYCANNRFH